MGFWAMPPFYHPAVIPLPRRTTALSRSRCPDGQTRMCSSGDGFSWVRRRGGEEFGQEMITRVVFGLLILNAPACRFGGFRASQTHPCFRGHRHPRRSSDSVAGRSTCAASRRPWPRSRVGRCRHRSRVRLSRLWGAVFLQSLLVGLLWRILHRFLGVSVFCVPTVSVPRVWVLRRVSRSSGPGHAADGRSLRGRLPRRHGG